MLFFMWRLRFSQMGGGGGIIFFRGIEIFSMQRLIIIARGNYIITI